jgi:ABC-type Fe3+/spermidine/putrescine transport system ATPase subunit
LTAFVADFIGDMNFIEAEVVEAENGAFAAVAGDGVVIRGRGNTVRGSRVRIGVRPERIVALPGTAESAPNSVPAEVVAKLYLGDQVQLLSRLANDVEILVREQRAGAHPGIDAIHPGDQVVLSWDESAPLLLGEADRQETPSEEEET